ncbi:MAG: hypothetical protein O2779_02515 [Nanoarchaeota archaeon]|nr:hypothetical protein [Nanoarchaeota archaeon]
MVFRYKWNPKFSEIFCNAIVKASVGIGKHDQEIPDVGSELSKRQGASFLSHIDIILDHLDMIVFSASSLLYREEMVLIGFGKKVEKACSWLLKRIEKDKRFLAKDRKKLETLMSDVHKKLGKVKLTHKKMQKDGKLLEKDSRQYESYLETLHETISHIDEVAEKIHGLDQVGKAQKRGTLSPAYIKERLSVRSNYGLVSLIKREAIEVDQALKGIAKKSKQLRRIVSKKGDLDEVAQKRLFKLCEIEAEDIKLIFEHALTVKVRVHSQLQRFARHAMMLELTARYAKVKTHYGELTDEIRTQQKRMSNEFETIDIKERVTREKINHALSKRAA